MDKKREKATERFKTANISELETWAKNLGNRYSDDTQRAAIAELVRRVIVMDRILSLPREAE